MSLKSIGDINRYVSESINPLNYPNQEFELYSVPSFSTGRPEVVFGKDIGASKQIVNKNDILICKINPRINRVWKVGQFTDKPLLASSEWVVFRNSEINPDYLVYYFSSPLFRQYLNSELTGIGGSLTRAQPKQIRKYPVPIPSRNEQDKIATILNNISYLINARNIQLKKFDELVKSRFVELFGDPIADTPKFPLKKIREFAKCIAGATPSTKNEQYWKNGNIPWMSSGEVHDTRVWSTDKKITQLGYNSCSTKMIPAHTVVIAMAGQGKTRGTVAVAEIPLCTNQSLCSILTDKTIDTDYLFTYLRFQYNSLRNISNGSSGRGGLNIKLIGEFRVSVPPLSMQKQFSLFLNQLDKSKLAVQKSLNELEVLKKSLMQQYFG